jgi:diamine N-acetyltransferase
MPITLSNQKRVHIRLLQAEDADKLFRFLQNLSPATQKRFAPHSYEQMARIVATEEESSEIIGYFLLLNGIVWHDKDRLDAIGFRLPPQKVCTIAPVLADNWQGSGLAKEMMNYALGIANNWHKNHVLLWGGVQADNAQAIRFYEKFGFRKIHEFEYQGLNWDMLKDLAVFVRV